jgi:hypothetical protein
VTARLTAAEARAIGITASASTRGRTTRRVARGPYRTTCTRCGATFHTQAAEDRHLTATRHTRYQLVIARRPDRRTP